MGIVANSDTLVVELEDDTYIHYVRVHRPVGIALSLPAHRVMYVSSDQEVWDSWNDQRKSCHCFVAVLSDQSCCFAGMNESSTLTEMKALDRVIRLLRRTIKPLGCLSCKYMAGTLSCKNFPPWTGLFLESLWYFLGNYCFWESCAFASVGKSMSRIPSFAYQVPAITQSCRDIGIPHFASKEDSLSDHCRSTARGNRGLCNWRQRIGHRDWRQSSRFVRESPEGLVPTLSGGCCAGGKTLENPAH